MFCAHLFDWKRVKTLKRVRKSLSPSFPLNKPLEECTISDFHTQLSFHMSYTWLILKTKISHFHSDDFCVLVPRPTQFSSQSQTYQLRVANEKGLLFTVTQLPHKSLLPKWLLHCNSIEKRKEGGAKMGLMNRFCAGLNVMFFQSAFFWEICLFRWKCLKLGR